MKYTNWLLGLSLVLLSDIGLAKVVATVGDTKIDSSEVATQAKLIVKASNGKIQDSHNLRLDILQKLVSRKVAVQEAKRLQLDKSQAYLQQLETAREQANQKGWAKQPGFNGDFAAYSEVLLANVYAVNFLKTHPISEQKIRSAYTQRVQFYKGSQEVKIGEILAKDQLNAEQAIAALKRNEPFTAVASRYTTDPALKKTSGVYANYLNLKDMQVVSPSYYQVVNSLSKGQFTQNPLVAGNRYLVIKVLDKRPAQIPSYEKIKGKLRNEMLSNEFAQESQRLKKNYRIKLYPAAL
ncbi:MAG: peptidyl-prolyl cis-trans isomerase [Neisseriaceae bacterium]